MNTPLLMDAVPDVASSWILQVTLRHAVDALQLCLYFALELALRDQKGRSGSSRFVIAIRPLCHRSTGVFQLTRITSDTSDGETRNLAVDPHTHVQWQRVSSS